MQFESGTRVGSFEVRSRLGAGGMGEVFRARDTRLQRDVALKVLPPLFADDADRLARFEREAQVLASLNHPHIAAIYGLEQSGGSRFLVLELVEGETLAERLEKLPRHADVAAVGLPVPEALSIARQIADGLQAAHERGIVHRDLKPSNIAVTHDGQVKVLDFGLAKLDGEPAPDSAPASDPNAATVPPIAGLSKSPTMSPPAMTVAGAILGTAPYMSPEQAKGRPADKRSDVWAFGCVLYEMLTGRPAFSGEDVADTLANVLKAEPDWNAMPADVPAPVRTLVRKCLDKDRRQRTADISVAAFILDQPEPLTVTVPAGTTRGPGSWWKQRIGIAALGVLVGSAITAAAFWYLSRGSSAPVSRLAITTSGATAFVPVGNDRELAISPDGRRIAYVGANGTIFVRALDQLEPIAVKGLGFPRGLFFSPDSQWIGFFDAVTLKKVAVTGGSPISLCRITGVARGGTWGRDDTIVFATNDRSSGLLGVPAGGGDPIVLTRPDAQSDEGDHLWPEFVPGADAVLFTVVPAGSALENARIALFDLQRGTRKVLLDRGTHAHYVSSGHLIYAHAGTVRAAAFDPAALELKGTPAQVLPQVVTTRFGAGEFDVSLDGTLVYQPASARPPSRTLVWVDRQGREEPIVLPARPYLHLRLSPDGKRAAVEMQEDIWIWEVGRDSATRLTFDPAADRFPIWMPDGRRIIFGSERTSNGMANLFVQAADGSGAVERLTESPNQQFPMSIAPDGRTLVFRESAPSLDLMLLPLGGARPPSTALLNTTFAEQNGEVSPDGRWLAYQSNESGRFEIYVRPFPSVESGRWQISTEGGVQPLWSKSGSELFFLSANGALMVLPISRAIGSTAPRMSWTAGNPTKLFDDTYFHGAGAGVGRTYDVTPDGRRFLMIKQGGGSDATDSTDLIVVQNWFEELRRLVPRR